MEVKTLVIWGFWGYAVKFIIGAINRGATVLQFNNGPYGSTRAGELWIFLVSLITFRVITSPHVVGLWIVCFWASDTV